MMARDVCVSPSAKVVEVAVTPSPSQNEPKQNFAMLLARASMPVSQTPNAKDAAVNLSPTVAAKAKPADNNDLEPLASSNIPAKIFPKKEHPSLEKMSLPEGTAKDNSAENTLTIKTAKERKTDTQKTEAPVVAPSSSALPIEAQGGVAAIVPAQDSGNVQGTVPRNGDVADAHPLLIVLSTTAPQAGSSHSSLSSPEKSVATKPTLEEKGTSEGATAADISSAIAASAHTQGAADSSPTVAVKGLDDAIGPAQSATISLPSLAHALSAAPATVPNAGPAHSHVLPTSEPLSLTPVSASPGSNAGLSHTTLSSSPTSLEVGVATGTHGWLKVRAEMSGTGEVSALLTGSSQAAASKLQGELPALTSFLQVEKIQVSSLAVHAAVQVAAPSSDTSGGAGSFERSGNEAAGGTSRGTDDGAASGQQQQQAGHNANGIASPEGIETSGDVVSELPSGTAYGTEMSLGGNGLPSPVEYGSWLNVRV